MDRQIQRLLVQEIVVETWLNRLDGRGRPQYAPPVTIPCYIAGEVKMVRNVRGEEVPSTETAYLDGTHEASARVTLKDRVTMSDGRQPPIIAKQGLFNQFGKLDIVEVNF